MILDALGLDRNQYAYRGPCPVHKGDNPTAFWVNPEWACWACFTRGCHDEFGSDLIGLVRGIHKCSLEEAIKFVLHATGRAGDTPDIDAIEIKQFVRRAAKPEKTVEPFPEMDRRLLDLPHDVWYFLEMGFTHQTLSKFQAFYLDDIRRACIPIFIPSGLFVGFTGRTLLPVTKYNPKWKHFPKLPFLRHTLLGIHLAKSSIERTKAVVLVEGYQDVMKCHQAGITNAVGIGGNRFTPERRKLLLSMGVRKVILAADPDAGGSVATEQLIKHTDLYFDLDDRTSQFTKDPGKTPEEELRSILHE